MQLKVKEPSGTFVLFCPGLVILLRNESRRAHSQFSPLFRGKLYFVEGVICEWLFQVRMDGISDLFLSVRKWDLSPLHGYSTLCVEPAHQQNSQITTSIANCWTHPHTQGCVYLSCVFDLKAQGSIGFRVQSLFPALLLPSSDPRQSCTSSPICTNEIVVSVSQGVLRSLVH